MVLNAKVLKGGCSKTKMEGGKQKGVSSLINEEP